MRKIVTLTLIFFALNSIAQQGKITQENLIQIRKSYDKNDSSTKALTNALSNNDVKNLVLNRENLGSVEHNFKYKVDVKGISDQKKSGRCWMFTSMNVLRPMVIDKYKLSGFEFSQNYLYFWDIFEKSNLYLEAQIKFADKPMDDKQVEWLFKSPVSDGGVWNSFTNLADKYGLVPKAVFPETHSSENTSWMIRIIKRKLREDGLELRNMHTTKIEYKQLESMKLMMLAEVYRILVMNLGEPPTNFTYRFADKDDNLGESKSYTPKIFMNEVLGEINFSDNIMLMNDPTREYNKVYEIEYDRNVMEGRNWTYLNLTNKEIKKFAVESIKNNKAMYASCDVGKQLNSDIGYSDVDNYDFESLYGVRFGMNKAQRIKTFESGSSHGMALIAVDVNNNEEPVKWQFENSWGAESGHSGYLTFTDDWFNEYMFRVVVHKDFIDAETLKLLDQKPIMLPPWDPMFQADE
ncbi:MAG: C1 family peptidase [Salinivirgaceae bacterium]|jgi:bleomycin hydrolase|nr:C1 family peptidase [Salinivirgaceae bacterium]